MAHDEQKVSKLSAATVRRRSMHHNINCRLCVCERIDDGCLCCLCLSIPYHPVLSLCLFVCWQDIASLACYKIYAYNCGYMCVPVEQLLFLPLSGNTFFSFSIFIVSLFCALFESSMSKSIGVAVPRVSWCLCVCCCILGQINLLLYLF